MKRRTFSLISALLHEQWAIDPFYALLHLEVVERVISGEPIAWVDREEDAEATGDVVDQVSELWIMDGGQWRRSSDAENVAGGVQLISIQGPIVKHGTCGDAGTVDYVEALNRAYSNKKVLSTVVAWDSPGGQLSGTPSLHDAIKNDAKPTISFVDDGMMASAAFWGAAPSDRIIASQKTDLIGSIGVYSTLRDYRDFYKQRGITSIDVYSRKSSKKNIEYRKALEGDLSELQNRLDKSAEAFIETVEDARGRKLTSKEWQEGGIYTAEEALTMGLIDGMGSLHHALSMAADMAKTRRQKTVNFSTNFNKSNQNMSNLLDRARAFLQGSATEGNTLDPAARDAVLETLSTLAEQRQAQITTLEQQLATATTARQTAEANLATATTSLATANATIATLTTERDDWKQKAETYGSQPGALATSTPKADDNPAAPPAPKVITSVDRELAEIKAAMKK